MANLALALAVALYLGAIVAANLLVAAYGPAVSVLNAFLFVGLDLTLRDELDARFRGRAAPMLALIVAGGLLSYLLNANAGVIAVASSVAFALATLADWTVYRALRGRPRWKRVNGSNVVGAAVDSVVFPTLAFGALMPVVIVLQFAAKTLGGAAWYLILHALSLRRNPV